MAKNQFKTERILSIDALRGFTMLWIIGGSEVLQSFSKVWNTPFTKAIYHQMEHENWEGFTFLDSIFPMFLFLVGVLIPYTIIRRIQQGIDHKTLYLHITKRTLVLLILGFIEYGFLRFDWDQMRWCSVLGRIGICYFFASILVMNSGWRTQAVVSGLILILYWAAMKFIPVPGYGPGVLTPEGSLSTFLDQKIIPGNSD
jgi:predicted acyltransferase